VGPWREGNHQSQSFFLHFFAKLNRFTFYLLYFYDSNKQYKPSVGLQQIKRMSYSSVRSNKLTKDDIICSPFCKGLFYGQGAAWMRGIEKEQ